MKAGKIILIMLIVSALSFVMPAVGAHAGDSPTFHSGMRAEGYYDQFEEDNIWYLVTKKAGNGKNGEIYAAGCRSFVEKLKPDYISRASD